MIEKIKVIFEAFKMYIDWLKNKNCRHIVKKE